VEPSKGFQRGHVPRVPSSGTFEWWKAADFNFRRPQLYRKLFVFGYLAILAARLSVDECRMTVLMGPASLNQTRCANEVAIHELKYNGGILLEEQITLTNIFNDDNSCAELGILKALNVQPDRYSQLLSR
jgi:hypothetical protein